MKRRTNRFDATPSQPVPPAPNAPSPAQTTAPTPSKELPQPTLLPPPVEPPVVTNRDLFMSLFSAYGPEGKEEKSVEAKATIRRYLTQVVEKYPIASMYNIVFLYDEMQMVQSDADNIYAATASFSETKPVLLILHSSGGYVGPAYLIGKLLHEYSRDRLEVAVPRRAKSGATLLCCAANHIHMGSLSELGPIDPQFEGLPALGLKSAIQHIAELAAEYPKSTELLARYMSQTIKPIHLGHYERVAESAVQYAERLLQPHVADLPQSPEKIAKDLVYSYKDHGFVIDKQEAQRIFGEKVLKHNTEEYQLANAAYQALVFISRVADAVNQKFFMIGSLATDPGLIMKK